MTAVLFPQVFAIFLYRYNHVTGHGTGQVSKLCSLELYFIELQLETELRNSRFMILSSSMSLTVLAHQSCINPETIVSKRDYESKHSIVETLVLSKSTSVQAPRLQRAVWEVCEYNLGCSNGQEYQQLLCSYAQMESSDSFIMNFSLVPRHANIEMSNISDFSRPMAYLFISKIC